MFVLILCINTLLRDTKDALAAAYLGADSLPLLKAWVVTPASLLACQMGGGWCGAHWVNARGACADSQSRSPGRL